MKEKRTIVVLIILGIVFLLMGGTLAYVNWQSSEAQQTQVTFTVTPDFSCSADAGGHITSNDRMLAPTDCMDPEYAIQRTITTSSTTSNDKVISMDLWLNVNSVSANLLASNNFKYAITKNKNSCTSGIINSGVVKDDIVNNKINLLEGAEYATLNDTYYLYIWLDEAETNHNTMNQSFDFSIDGECADNGLEKANLKSLNTTNYFREDDYKTKITDISFIYDKDLPSGITTNIVKTYDLGANTSKPITGYLINGDSEDTYKLYISSEYKIFAQQLDYAFSGMTALKNIIFDNFDTSLVTSTFSMFTSCRSLTSLNLSNFNTSNVTRMWNMFNGCSSLSSLDVSSFDTSNITSMQDMFRGCSSLTHLDLSSFDTSNVTSMHTMFTSCGSLTSLDLSNFDTSNVISMHGMFGSCSKLTTLDLSNFDTSKVKDMVQMFAGCNSLKKLNVSNFNTSSATNMSYMFHNCTNLIELDLSGFNTSSVVGNSDAYSGINSMFAECKNLEKIYVSNLWDISNITEANGLVFYNCYKLVGGAGTTYNFNNKGKEYARIDNPPDSPGYFTYKAYNGQ